MTASIRTYFISRSTEGPDEDTQSAEGPDEDIHLKFSRGT
jgi:hypothetical protein